MKLREQLVSEIKELRESIDSAMQSSIDSVRWLAPSLSAKRDALAALETGRCVFTGYGVRHVVVVGLHALPPEKLRAFVLTLAGNTKASGNLALEALDGCYAEIRMNAKETAWVVDCASPDRKLVVAWHWGPDDIRRHKYFPRGPRVPTTNGGGHWCGLVGGGMYYGDKQSEKEAVGVMLTALDQIERTGRTPMEQEEFLQTCLRATHEAAAIVAAYPYFGKAARAVASMHAKDLRGDLAVVIAQKAVELFESDRAAEAEAARQREEAELARLLAEEEAARKAAEEAARKAAEEAAQKAAEEAKIRALGYTPEQWAAMTPKQQRIALHNGRLHRLIA